MKLEGKVAIVTGSSRGLGEKITQAFADEGALIYGCSRTDKCDVTNELHVKDMVQNVIDLFGKIDILVCNAGIYGPINTVENISSVAFLNTFKTNVMGVLNCCQEVIPHLKKQGHGKIIIMSGGGATQPMPNFSAYAASKAAVVRFAETIAMELKEFNVQVNSVAPGMLKTDMVQRVVEVGPEIAGSDFYQKNLELTEEESNKSLQRAVGLITYLASDKSGDLTGKLIAAQWDPWDLWDDAQFLAGVKKDINESDVFTLRRIIRHDRGI